MKTANDPLSDYCEVLIRHIAALMLDPHRYFEQKLMGQLAQADTLPAQREMFQRLLAWTRPGELLDVSQAAQLDRLLGEQALPSAGLAHAHPELMANMLIGETEPEKLQRLLSDGCLEAADQRVVRAALAAARP